MVNRVNNTILNRKVNRENTRTVGDYANNLTTYIVDKRRTRDSEDIWFNDVSVLFNPAYVFEILPTTSMTLGEKINAITRFAFFLSLLLTIVKGNYIYIYIFIVPVIITYIVYIFSPNTREYFNTSDDYTQENVNITNSDDDLNNVMESALNDCHAPTDDNPLMNVLPTDNFQTRKMACNITKPGIAKNVTGKITNSYSERLYSDTSQIMNRSIGERDFYTMPNTRIPNDQKNFAKWLYETPISCITGNNGELAQHRSCAFNNKTLEELRKDIANMKDDEPPADSDFSNNAGNIGTNAEFENNFGANNGL
jgi:hypothetical protein